MNTRTAALLIILSIGLHAQQGGRLTGTVADASGAPMPDAKVHLSLEDGEAALLETVTSSEGIFSFIAVLPGVYKLDVEAPSFARYVQQGIRVSIGRELRLPVIQLSLASVTNTLEVTGTAELVSTASHEVVSTITQEQIRNLPVFDRQLSSLFLLQAGVSNNGRTTTVINGQRSSYSNVLLEGVNIQDSVRVNNVEFSGNYITIAQVAEFTASTANSNPAIGGGASTIMLTIPSGNNRFHGSLYWYNRNSALAANDWFANRNGVAQPFLNQNQGGVTFSGPIRRDRWFVFGNFEALRRSASTPANRVILSPEARQGLLRYRVGTQVQSFNVLQPSGLAPSAAVQNLLRQTPSEGNNSAFGDGLNTTGYTFNARNNDLRDNYTVKSDYYLSPSHSFSASFVPNRAVTDRPDLGTYMTVVPPLYNPSLTMLASGTYRWTPTASLTNELRTGFQRDHVTFENRQGNPAILVGGLNFTSPLNSSLREGRTNLNYTLQDNANWVKGRHKVSFGFQSFQQHVNSFAFAGTAPTYTLGISVASPFGFNVGQIPGATATDVGRGNALLSTLAGLVSSATQGFNVTSRDSGFVPGAPFTTNFSFQNHALYAVDTIQVHRHLHFTAGLRWDYFAPVNERDSLMVMPSAEGGNAAAVWAGNARLDFVGNSAGRPPYRKDLNNFAPSAGFAWDVFGKGITALRGGFNIAFLNDNTLNSVSNTARNSGITGTRALGNLNARLDAPPALPPPAFGLPSTFQTQFNINPTVLTSYTLTDPNLATPYTQQWNLALEHKWHGWIFEGRYIGSHTLKMLRQIDFNQVDLSRGGFLDDFKRARSNGLLALNASGVFNPNYNAAVAGSQQLTFFPRLPAGGNLANVTVLANLRAGEAGSLAQLYQANQFFPAPGFSYFPNPLILGGLTLTNLSHASYNAGQFEVRHRTRSGAQFQANYTFSKNLSDALAGRGTDPQLDNGNRRIERAISSLDQRHAFKLNHAYPLPFGGTSRLRFGNRLLNRFIEGWGLNGFLALYSGHPVGLLSARSTINRPGASTGNTVDTTLNHGQLLAATGLFMTGNGPSWINPKHVHPATGQGVSPDGAASFDGQIFFNPQAGAAGSLQRRTLRAPRYANYDFSLSKTTRLTEKQSLEVHADFFNLLNHANFVMGDQNINSSTFGRIFSQNYSSSGVGPRAVQFGLHYRF